MLLGVIADDFTGASDIANTLAKGGLSTVQFLGVPTKPAPETCEAGVVALKSRSITAADAVALSMEAFEWLRAQGCRQFVFKYCSTFDSTPEGNIGPVGEALAKAFDVRGAVACPAFPTTGRTVYQGHLFVGDRLLNESGLENHPLNPMTDPDLRRWLRRQCEESVGLVPWAMVRQGGAALRAALEAAADRAERLVIVDAVSDDDLLAIGDACAEAPLLTGGSGIALGLPRNFIRQGLATGKGSAFQGVDGPEAILAGSCSRATLQQIEVHRKEHPVLQVEVEAVMEGAVTPEALAAFMHGHEGEAPLVYSSAPSEKVRALQSAHGREAIAAALDALFAETAARLVYDGVRRLVVAGGETSGAVVSALSLDALAIGPEIDPGVPALAAADGRPLALALKSGNFGAPDFFAKALRTLSGR
ncbi:MAG TPA: 3-oxo-tetronate kinase [Beijerinckiaceae bacterium]|nr:3-oxo-tetronate kinase [Beijerinckiaceae bacterium]